MRGKKFKIILPLVAILSLVVFAVAAGQSVFVQPSVFVRNGNTTLGIMSQEPYDVLVWDLISSGNPWWYWYGYDAGTASVKYGRVRVNAAGKFVIEAEEEIIIASDFGIADDQLLTFGDDTDASIEYDETTDDLWKFGVPVSNDTFYITDTWVADDGASDWDEGAYLEAASGAAGKYMMSYTLSATEGGGAGSNWTVAVYHNDGEAKKSISKRKMANNDYGNMGGQAIVTIAAGDRVFLTAESSGVNTLTIQYGNLIIKRL